MRIESKLSLVAYSSSGREVKSLSGVHALKPLSVHACESYDTTLPRRHQADDEQMARKWNGEERRKTNRRVRQQPILMELRSGIDQRHQVQCDADLCEHIDEEA